ncbi:MAG: tetratricopeptide repeat protein [Chthoniobacterales bacterium]
MNQVDIRPKRFRIALSFAGEKRDFVAAVAAILAKRFLKEKILYDKFHRAEFARDDLAGHLTKLYRDESDLIVAILCPDYDKKEWCGLEWKTIRGLLKHRRADEIMFTRFKNVEPKELEGLAGYIELDHETPITAAALILERLALNEGKRREYYKRDVMTLLTPIANNLPRLQPFFGREKQLADIKAALSHDARVWGTLIDGGGGIGKTSLAVRAAHECTLTDFERIVFVSVKQCEQDDYRLRPLDGFALSSWLEMLNEIGSELRLEEVLKAPEKERAYRLRDALKGRRVLLLLDNLETLTEREQNELFTFLEFLPAGCKALLTSRVFAGNKVQAIDLDELDLPSALKLLAEIALHSPALAASTDEQRALLYKDTNGNPLLLRWVAGQVGTGDCTCIADALTRLRDCPSGNDPLNFIFGDILGELVAQDVQVVATLSHPAQPIPVEAVAEISGMPLERTRTVLKDLTNRPLVVAQQNEQAYALLPMVADFVRHKRPQVVAEMGNRLEQRAHALIVENGYQAYDRFPVLDAAWHSVAPALPLFLAGPNPRLQTVCDALTDFLEFTGRWDEWLSLSRRAEARAVAAGDHAKAGWRAKDAAYAHFLRQEADGVLAYADRMAEHWREAEVGASEHATAIRFRGLAYQLKKDYPVAIVAYRQALDLHRSVSAESVEVAIDLNSIGVAEQLGGNFAAADLAYRDALQVARAVDFVEGVASYTGNLAACAAAQEDWPRAETLAREALPLAERVGREQLIANNCHRIAQALLRQGMVTEAQSHARRAVEIYGKLGSPDLAAARATLSECES